MVGNALSAVDRSKKHICILGGTGFLGKHLICLLKNEKDIRIKAFSRRSSDGDLSQNVQVVSGDLLNPASLDRFLETGSVVINLAHLNSSSADDNLVAVRSLTTACNHAGIKKLIHISTAAVVGRTTERIITENTPCHPVSEYERIKFEIESLLIRQLDERLPVIILRPTAIYGKGGKNLVKQINDLVYGKPLINHIRYALYNKRRLNLVHVQNVVSAIRFFICQAGRGVHGDRYIVSDDEFAENNYADVADMITQIFDLPPLRYFTIPLRRSILKILLRIKGRSNPYPERIYSSEKLMQTGFIKPMKFTEGMNDFLSDLARKGLNTV